MFCQGLCSCTMWSKLRKKVLKSRNYELQSNGPLTDLDDEDAQLEKYDKTQGSPSRRENRRSTNGFTKCLIPHLTNSPIGCACKKNVSPAETPEPVTDKVLDGSKARNGKESKKSADDKKNNTVKSGFSKIEDRSLNYYFKETDSCETVRKNKNSTHSAGGTKSQKSKNGDKTTALNNQHSQMSKNKQNNQIFRSTSMKDPTKTLPLFSAGQREIKSGIDFKDFQRVFENSQESIADQTKTVTFETFGKDLPENEVKKPPLFQPIRTKKIIEESPEIPICNPSLLDGSLSSSSKGASLTSEEGAESGYGTQDDGNDRLARSISSNSDCNATDFPTDLEKLMCSISRESTGEEDVFHHQPDHQHHDKVNPSNKVSLNDERNRFKRPAAMSTVELTPVKVAPNRNVVVAEIHAENFDEPRPCASKWISGPENTLDKVKLILPRIVDKQNNNSRGNTSVTNTLFDVNCNPELQQKNTANITFHTTNRDLNKTVESQEPAETDGRTSSTDGASYDTPDDSDSDQEDIREYLPADVSSMSEVYNTSRSERGLISGQSRPITELYASVPKLLEEAPLPPPPPPEITKSFDPAMSTEATDVTPVKHTPEKLLVRPDVIDCHDVMEPMVTETAAPEHRPASPDGSEDETIHLDYGEENFSDVVSDDGDSGPPLPSRNYSKSGQTLTRDEHFTDLETLQCEAPTLVLRRKSPDKESTSDSDQSTREREAEMQDPEEITTVEEPIHMTWEEVMKEAKSLGIPLNPPTISQTLDRRSSASSQDSSSTPVASPIKRTVKVKRGHSDSKKKSPFKEKFKLQNLFTLRKSKGDSAKTLHSDHKMERAYNRRSVPASAYDGTAGCIATTPRSNKSCSCSTPEAYRVTSPIQYTYYAHHTPRHHQMNVSINVSVISSQTSGGAATPSSPVPDMMSPECISGATTPSATMSRSLVSHHSMSNQSLSQQSITSGQSAHSYQSAHSATSVGSPTHQQRRTGASKGGATPNNSPSYHGTNTLVSAINSNYGTNGTVSLGNNGYYSTNYGTAGGGGGGCIEGTGGNADFIGSLLKLKDCGWYWGPLGWDDAEGKLANKADGSFLVRDSSDDRYILSLSFRSQGTTHHTRIEHYKGMFSFYSQPKSHGAATIVEFIEKAMEHSRNGKFLYFLRPRAPGLPPAPVQLLYPVSRLQNMQSLQHMCRFVILKQVRKDHIDRLPIPPRLKEYLKQNQYYTEYLGGEAIAVGAAPDNYPLL